MFDRRMECRGRGVDVTVYEFVLFLHIGSAIVLVGGSIVATPAIRAAAVRARTVSEVRTWASFGRPFVTINPVTSLTLLATGLYLTAAGSWWNAAWVHVAIVLWVANAILAAAVVNPAAARVGQAAATAPDGAVDADLDRLRRAPSWSVGSDVMLANDVGVLLLMVVKPGYLWAVGAVSVLHVLVHSWRELRSRQLTRTSPPAPTPLDAAR
jgi:uncharacterized membrane protein